MNPVVEEWLLKAEGDFRVANREMAVTDYPSYDIICYHAQQCLEKLFKAVLISRCQKAPKSHDLFNLAERIKDCCPELGLEPADDLEWLSVKSVGSRYPGVLITEQDARKSIAIGQIFRQKILAFLKGE